MSSRHHHRPTTSHAPPKPTTKPKLPISAFVALLDILPFIYKRCPWRYKAAVYFQVIATGMVVFGEALSPADLAGMVLLAAALVFARVGDRR